MRRYDRLCRPQFDFGKTSVRLAAPEAECLAISGQSSMDVDSTHEPGWIPLVLSFRSTFYVKLRKGFPFASSGTKHKA
jgi:hypothetical protein